MVTDFKIGDYVQVVNNIDGNQLGWEDSYVAVGDEVEIVKLELYHGMAIAKVTSDKLKRRTGIIQTWAIYTHSLAHSRGPW